MWPEDSCTFESGTEIIKIDSSYSNVWQIGQPSKLNFNSAYSGSLAIMTDTAAAIPVNSDSFFEAIYTMDEFWFIPYTFVLSFKHKFDTEIGSDGGYITISFDNRQTWHNIIEENFDYGWSLQPSWCSDNLYSPEDTLVNGESGFSGNSGAWIESSFQYGLLPVKYYGDTLIVRFNYVSDSVQDASEGWMIDDLVLHFVDLGGETRFAQPDHGFAIYPNPAKDYISIITEDVRRPLQFEIYSILGEKVFEKDLILDFETVDVSSLNKGNYIVRLVSYRQVKSKKLIINR
jgi:hypothetical protein